MRKKPGLHHFLSPALLISIIVAYSFTFSIASVRISSSRARNVFNRLSFSQPTCFLATFTLHLRSGAIIFSIDSAILFIKLRFWKAVRSIISTSSSKKLTSKCQCRRFSTLSRYRDRVDYAEKNTIPKINDNRFSYVCA